MTKQELNALRKQVTQMENKATFKSIIGAIISAAGCMIGGSLFVDGCYELGRMAEMKSVMDYVNVEEE